MDLHIDVLLRHARAARDPESDDVYVWWGKLRSRYRQAPLPHLDDVLALDAQLAADDEREVHLYLTDYRSLYVAHLAHISSDDVRLDDKERAHIPEYYFGDGMNADCWFQIWDIRRLVLDDTTAVAHELRSLRDTRYNDQRVSLFGGMRDLPLIVTREDDARWFDAETRESLTAGRHWVEFDAERAGTGEMQRELRDNRFGAALWSNLDPAARGFIATAEQLFRAHRGDAAFDLATVIVDFAKAVEVQVNRIVRLALADAPPALRYMNFGGQSVDLCGGRTWSLGELSRAIGGEKARLDWFTKNLVNGTWFTTSLPPILEELREVRNPASHGTTVDRLRVEQLRASLIGVGSTGTLVELARVQRRS